MLLTFFKKNNKLRLSKIVSILFFLVILISINYPPNFSFFIDKIKLTKARFLTQNSTMIWINYVSSWYDATDSKAFLSNESKDNHQITIWKSSKTIYNEGFSVEQPNVANKPTFLKKGIAGLPSVRFDGVDDYLFSKNFQSDILRYKSASFFIVFEPQEKCSNSKQVLFFQDFFKEFSSDNLGGKLRSKLDSNFCDKNLEIAYFTKKILSSFDDKKYCKNKPAPIPFKLFAKKRFILGVLMKQEFVKNQIIVKSRFFLNGIPLISFEKSYKNDKLQNSNKTPLGTFYVGGKKDYGGDYANQNSLFNFSGLIGEIIIFDRSLNEFDQQKLEEYLQKKWDI